MNLRESAPLLKTEELGPLGAVAALDTLLRPSKEGSREPDAWMRVTDPEIGIKLIYKTALDGAASKRIVVAVHATPKSK